MELLFKYLSTKYIVKKIFFYYLEHLLQANILSCLQLINSLLF